MKSFFGGVLLSLALFIHFYLPSFKPEPTIIEASQSPQEEQNLQPIKTTSRFTEKLIEDTQTIPQKTIYKDNPEIEAGTDTVLEEGKDGKKTTITKITYYKTDTSEVGFDPLRQSSSEASSSEVDQGKEYSREIVDTETQEPKDKLISRGTKIIWKVLDTNEGQIKYWKKIHVWATHYDSHCPGCDEWTATGMRAGKGVIAVDPKVIKLGSRVYIPGYGLAIAGDTGGAIKGNIIDLGFEDAKTAGWNARFVDIYLLN